MTRRKNPTYDYTTETFDSNGIRVLRAEGGPWFAMRDILKALDIPHTGHRRSRVTSSIFSVTPRYQRTLSVQTEGVGNPRLICINLRGLAEFFASRRGTSQTLAFMRWATELDERLNPPEDVSPSPSASVHGFTPVAVDKVVTAEAVEVMQEAFHETLGTYYATLRQEIDDLTKALAAKTDEQRRVRTMMMAFAKQAA